MSSNVLRHQIIWGTVCDVSDILQIVLCFVMINKCIAMHVGTIHKICWSDYVLFKMKVNLKDTDTYVWHIMAKSCKVWFGFYMMYKKTSYGACSIFSCGVMFWILLDDHIRVVLNWTIFMSDHCTWDRTKLKNEYYFCGY